MARAARYDVLYVMPDGKRLKKSVIGAPSFMQVDAWKPDGAIYAMRYYPSRKAWRVFDFRLNTMVVMMRRGRRRTIPQAEHRAREFPCVEAAIMYATLRG